MTTKATKAAASVLRDESKVPLDLMRKWIDESYRAIAPKKLIALIGERG